MTPASGGWFQGDGSAAVLRPGAGTGPTRSCRVPARIRPFPAAVPEGVSGGGWDLAGGPVTCGAGFSDRKGARFGTGAVDMTAGHPWCGNDRKPDPGAVRADAGFHVAFCSFVGMDPK